MAVEANHMNIFSPQFITSNRDDVRFQQNMNHNEFYFGGGGDVPLITSESLAVNPSFNKPENGLTYNFNIPSQSSTIRPREFQFDSDAQFVSTIKRRSVEFDSSSSLINAEFISQIQNQQQSEINRFVAQQTEKLRMEIGVQQKMLTRMLASAVQNTVAKKLKEKDDEIVRIRNLNWVLQERAKNFYVENRKWRDIAQTNEATANNLRTNLHRLFAQIGTFPIASHAAEDDVESSCGDNNGGEAVSGGCKGCGERVASVLVLPCRHLCLCTVCGSALLQTCPVCDLVMTGSVHVNMSS